MSLFKRKRTPTSQEEYSHPSQSPFIGVQAKLKVGDSNDKYEKEADAVANKVVQKKGLFGSEPFFAPSDSKINANDGTHVQEKALSDGITPYVQTKAEEEPVQMNQDLAVQKQEEEEAVQTKALEEEPVQKQEEEEVVQTKAEDEEPIQKQEEEEAVQAKSEEEEPIQKQEEEEAVQAKAEEEEPIQKQEEEESVQAKAEEEETVQKQEEEEAVQAKRTNSSVSSNRLLRVD